MNPYNPNLPMMKLSNKPVFSVSEVTEYIKLMFEGSAVLNSIYIQGEISNYKLHSSGHHYMSLKDQDAVINAVMFRSSASNLKFALSSGMKVIIKGRVSVFPKSGQYQVYIENIIPDGVGELYLAFEQLKERLGKEGLFDEKLKKPLPKYPKKIALITSPTGAAVQDMIRIIQNRFPPVEILVCPVNVQGDGSAQSISAMIEFVNKHKLCDLIITGRGGGSIEDLWAFNEEIVAYAIAKSKIPVISAVGHEPDVTISDFVADVRASTPSNAAEIAVPDYDEIKFTLNKYKLSIKNSVLKNIRMARDRLSYVSSKRVLSSKMAVIDEKRMSLEVQTQRIISDINNIILKNRNMFVKYTSKIEAMSPLKVLARGYSIASKSDGAIIKSASDLQKDEIFNVKLEKGTVTCAVVNTTD